MEASGVTASLRPKEVLESRHEFTEEDLELALANMACVDLIFKFQATQTDSTTQDFGVNTDADWESQVAAMFEYSVTLSDKYEKLMLKQSDEEAATELHKINLQKKKEEATRQHLALLEKLESLRVKLQLNNSKATKKNFLSKKQEMTSEKTRAEDERNRLAKELEDSERKLSSLSSEHSEEQRRWTEELEELRSEMERVRRDAQEKELIALKDEISAVERQRDTAMGHIQAWLGEVGVYLNTLRVEFPQQFPQERVKWEKQEEAVIRSKAELERRYQDVLQQLQQGRELESLPTINMPALPQVPMQRSSLEDLGDSMWSSSSFSVSTQSVWDSAASSVPSPHRRLTSIYTSRLDTPKAEVNGPIVLSELDAREPGTTTAIAPTTSPPPTEANQGNTSTAPAKSSTPKPVQHPWCTVECRGRKRSRLAGERVPSSQPPMELSNHFDLLKPEDDATMVQLDDATTTSPYPVQISIVARSDTLEANEVNGPIDFSGTDTREPGTTTTAPTTTTPPRTDANQGNTSTAPAKSSTPKPRCRGRKRSTLAGERVPSSQPPMELSNHFDLLKPEDDATTVHLDDATTTSPHPVQISFVARSDTLEAKEVNGPIDFSELDTREPGTTTTAPTTTTPPRTDANQGNTSTAPAKSSTPKPRCRGRKRSTLAGERVSSSQPPMELSNHFDLLKPEDDATMVQLDDATTTSPHPVQISFVARSDTLEANEVNGPIDFSGTDTREPGTTTIAPTTTTPPRTDANQGNTSTAPAKSSRPKPRCRGRKRSTLAGERVPSSQPPMELSNHFDLLKPEDDATMVQLDDATTTSPHPVAQLRFNQVMQTIVRPHFMPPPNQRHLHPPPPHTHAPIPNPNPHFYQPQPGHFIPPQFQHRHRFNPPPPNQPQPNINQHHYIAPAHPPTQPMRAPQIPNLPIGAQQPLQNPIRAPVQPQNPMNGSPVNPVSPSPPPATAKLDMVLEKLGARFPQCDRAQLTSLLQQVKSSRGTLAGMSMEDLMDHVNRLIQNGRSAPGPISRPTPPGPIQRPTPPPDRRALGAVGLGRKPCLVCQNMVDLESRHPLSCSHTIHKDCIRMWLQTSKNNTCPFCG